MKLKLLIERERGKANIFEFESAYCIVGRKNSNLTLSDPRCSSQHCLLYEGPDARLWVKDLDSTNGTFINGTKTVDSILSVGDEVRLGKTTLVIREFIPAADHSGNQRRPEEKETLEASGSSMESADSYKPPDAPQDSYTASGHEPGLISRWPENMFCVPKGAQEQFLEYVDEQGTRTRVRLKTLLKGSE